MLKFLPWKMTGQLAGEMKGQTRLITYIHMIHIRIEYNKYRIKKYPPAKQFHKVPEVKNEAEKHIASSEILLRTFHLK